MQSHFPVIIEQDSDGVFLVECPQFKGCRSYGKTIHEAMENIKEAIEACIEDEPFFTDVSTFIGILTLLFILLPLTFVLYPCFSLYLKP